MISRGIHRRGSVGSKPGLDYAPTASGEQGFIAQHNTVIHDLPYPEYSAPAPSRKLTAPDVPQDDDEYDLEDQLINDLRKFFQLIRTARNARAFRFRRDVDS